MIKYLVGTDEAGRGCWAGPIFGAAVIIPEELKNNIPKEIKDSKLLTEKKREEMFDYIINNYIYHIHSISAKEIDEKGLQWANKEVMIYSVEKLKEKGIEIEETLIDGNMKFEYFPTKYKSIIDGDVLISEISAASILAKVSRDKYLIKLANEFPEYSFEKHKGYGTKLHIEALNKYGITKEHRLSYKPIKKIIGIN